MVQPLVFDPDATAQAQQGWWRYNRGVCFLLLFAALLLSFQLIMNGGIMNGVPARVELLLRALPFALLMLMFAIVFARPRRYRVADDEVVARRFRFATAGARGFVNTVMLWPAPILSLIALVSIYVRGEAGPVNAIVVPVVIFIYSVACFMLLPILLTEIEVRFNSSGVRAGYYYFAEWENIASIVDSGEYLEVIHKAYAPTLISISNKGERANAFREQAIVRSIPIRQGSNPANNLVVFQHGVVAVLLFGIGVWMMVYRENDPFMVCSLLLGTSILLMKEIETRRGLSKVTRIIPAVDRAFFKLKPGQKLPEPAIVAPIPEVPPINK